MVRASCAGEARERKTRARCEDDDEGSLAAGADETREADQGRSLSLDDITSTLDTTPFPLPNASNVCIQKPHVGLVLASLSLILKPPVSLSVSSHPPTWRRHPSLVHNEIINAV